jgi:predicted O-methyltransferase YrrM
MLNTGWKSWDKYLSKFQNKQINIMEIGVYKGDATCWFLNNLITNKKSKIIAVDTFGGSFEYSSDIDFKDIERQFNKNIKDTGKSSQVFLLKMTSYEALIKLSKKNKQYFDIIFIDASHEARDVITDGILSWKLLKDEGILIFDDYECKKHEQEYFRPKLAIDSFIDIMNPELNVLSKKWQVLIEKRKQNDYDVPKLSQKEYIIQLKQLINSINYNLFSINLNGHDNKIKYNYKTDTIPDNINNKLINLIEDRRMQKYDKYLNINYLLLHDKYSSVKLKKWINIYKKQKYDLNILLFNLNKKYNYGEENTLYFDILNTKINSNAKKNKCT